MPWGYFLQWRLASGVQAPQTSFFNTIFVSSHMYQENPEGTQVIVGSMNMGYISDTARNRTHNLLHPKREPIPLGHSDGQGHSDRHIPYSVWFFTLYWYWRNTCMYYYCSLSWRGPWMVSWSVDSLVVREWSCGPWVVLWSVGGLVVRGCLRYFQCVTFNILDSVSCDFRFVKILL